MNTPKRSFPIARKHLFFSIAVGFALIAGQSRLFAAAGDLYEADYQTGTINRFTPAGAKTPFAGGLGTPSGVAFDRAGNLYVTDRTGGLVFKVTPAATKSTFATGLNSPGGLAFDVAGDLFVAENVNSQVADKNIVRITPTGTKTVFASGLGGPKSLAFDSAGNLFVADSLQNNHVILKYTPTGQKSVFAPLASYPNGMAFDREGNLYLAMFNTIERFTPAGTQSTFAPSSVAPYALAFDAAGNLFASVTNGVNTIVKYRPDGTQSTFASGLYTPLGLTVEPPRGKSLNISTRVQVQTGDNAAIAGIIITGSAGKRVLLRAIGPSLANLGVQGSLQDPVLQFFNRAGGFVNGNDNWKFPNQAAIEATGLAPSDDRESALIISLGSEPYTVVVRGKNNTTGVGVVEVYDLDPAADSRLANISTRGLVGTGENVLIGGFILGGNGARGIVRAIGPSLTAVGVAGALSNPVLSIRDANGVEIASNDDWKATQRTEIEATGVPPQHDLESAYVGYFPPGNNTVIVSGSQESTGVGLVEFYNLQ